MVAGTSFTPDSPIVNTIATTPLIGEIVSTVRKIDLKIRFDREQDLETKIQMGQELTKYRFLDAKRNKFSAITTVALMALNVISASFLSWVVFGVFVYRYFKANSSAEIGQQFLNNQPDRDSLARFF